MLVAGRYPRAGYLAPISLTLRRDVNLHFGHRKLYMMYNRTNWTYNHSPYVMKIVRGVLKIPLLKKKLKTYTLSLFTREPDSVFYHNLGLHLVQYVRKLRRFCGVNKNFYEHVTIIFARKPYFIHGVRFYYTKNCVPPYRTSCDK